MTFFEFIIPVAALSVALIGALLLRHEAKLLDDRAQKVTPGE